MKRRFAILAVAAVAAFGAATAAPASPQVALQPLAAAKTCHAGWTRAVIGGQEKCLRVGQFCARRYDGQYHRYGFHCHRYDARVGRYRLTR